MEAVRAEVDDRPFAVVDVGSNSARMIVFRSRPGEHLDVLEDARAPLRLGRELRDDDRLGTEAIDRAVAALRDFRAIADAADARRMIAVATSAVREAADGDVLVARANELGVPLQVIDGDLEARFGFRGAVHDLPVTDGAAVDIGGGSMELTTFRDRRIRRSWTFPLGSLRVSDRFLTEDPPSDGEIKALRKAARAAFEDARVPALERKDALVGIGGTVRNLAKLDLRRTEHPLPLLHGYELAEPDLVELVDDLASRSMKRRARLRGLNPDRADSILGGAVVLLATLRHLDADRVVISSRGLREGLALGDPTTPIPTAREVRTISVATLAARFATWEAEPAARRSSLAAQLFEALDPDAEPALAELLEHAAVLLDVGRAIDYYERFEHAAMIVTTADLAGFPHRSLAILSAILRYAGGEQSLGPSARLIAANERPAVRRAAVALELAEELHRRIPRDEAPVVRCRPGRRFEVEAPMPAPWDPRGVADRFRAVFQSRLEIVPAPTPRPSASVIRPD
ncbi:MAG TPA: Ppx/GppA phosphatase family protein [Actinomycetota bacterium]|nr:Ppx/GppA phosphatase family protein [Actinomycetota bacterium]